jgi:hypothetical protein
VVDIQSLAIEAPNYIQSSYEVCTLCVLQDPVVGLSEMMQDLLQGVPIPLAANLATNLAIWTFG